jgi:gamma-glutamyl:cysteine ligase YbdK (ATP-grasp superfamily)
VPRRDARLHAELTRLRELVDHGAIADGGNLVGVELELHIVDEYGRPSPCNDRVLDRLADSPHDVQSELARFNIEVNLPPRALDAMPLSSIRDDLDAARRAASAVVPGTSAVSIGTLPTLERGDVRPDAISGRGRYRELDAAITGAHGGAIVLAIDGHDAGGERLGITLGSITLEAAATSLQVHLDLPADGLPAAWNAAQAVAGVQVAVAANSPVLLGRTLWHETRVPLFEQLIDVRAASRRPHWKTERAQRIEGEPPSRVWFGERWIDHPVDLFAENLEYFPELLVSLPTDDDAEEGDADALAALVLHNGTVWRWNRPVYASAGPGRHTLRIENRVLSAPPSAADAAADVALFVGLVAGLRDDIEALTSQLDFPQADANFRAAARQGLAAPLRWPGVAGTITAGELLVDLLIEVAADGLDALGVPTTESGPALDIIAARASEGRNGAAWQLATLAEEEIHHDRRTALQRMLLRYRDLQAEGEPVHRWPWPTTPVT